MNPALTPVLSEFSKKIQESLSQNCVAILVYGSAVNVNYNPAISDVNVAVIVKNLDFHVLEQVKEIVKWGHKRRMAIPLFLTKEYILNSLDVFPIEFTEIKERHELIWGEDVFKDLDIPRRDIHLLCEQQIKGKLLHLRQAYLEIGPNAAELKKYVLGAFNDLMPVFRQLIVLKDQKPDEDKEAMLGQLAEIFTLDPAPFQAFLHDRHQRQVIAPRQLEAHLENFLNQLEKLSRHLDAL